MRNLKCMFEKVGLTHIGICGYELYYFIDLFATLLAAKTNKSILIRFVVTCRGYTSDAFTIFNGYFDWATMNFWSSDQGTVQPGQTVYAYVQYIASNNSYNMFISCIETGWSILNNIPVDQQQTYTDSYFVLEHQPDDCQGYPSDGVVTFYDINLALNNKPVVPSWTARQWEPACNSQAAVISSSSVQFTWSAN
jgi:hypothetical protein